uniref:Uncharacterized protein n=1 Tax=Grammatophora oceanica TaxID=210454 RepID=A0A7S1Y4E7_9STRA
MIDLQIAYSKQEEDPSAAAASPPPPPAPDALPPRDDDSASHQARMTMYTATPPMQRVLKSITDEPVLKPMPSSSTTTATTSSTTTRSILPNYGAVTSSSSNYGGGGMTATSTTSNSYASGTTATNSPPPTQLSSLQQQQQLHPPQYQLNSSSMSPEDPENPTMVGMGQIVFSSDYPREGYGVSYQQQQQQLSPSDSEERRERMLLMMNSEHPEHPDYVLETGGVGGILTPEDHHGLHHHHHHHTGAGVQPSSKDEACCCCCWNPMVHWFRNSLWTEAVLRSVCFGAIDGTLTGAGIVATFVGLGLLENIGSSASSNGGDDDFSAQQIDLSSMMMVIMMCVCFTACVSDSIGMALGHVWSTHWTASQAAQAQKEQRIECHIRPTEAKARLVDLLLSRGMLKIDAISVADTLEGYPDLFLCALLGSSGGDMALFGAGDDAGGGGGGGGAAGMVAGGMRTSSRDRGLVMAGANNTYTKQSYGQFKEWEHDPEVASVSQATKEAQIEGLAMMLSFSLVSLIPSLVYLGTCWALQSSAASSSSSYSSTTMTTTTTTSSFSADDGDDNGGAVSIPTMAMSLGSVWMLGLGIWKSRFMGESPSNTNSGWIFGMETVLVLWICVVSAYAVGRGLWWTVLLKHHEQTS